MQAVLLVGGLGTRLRPLTDHVPKALLPVRGIPMIEVQLLRLRRAGVRRVVLALAHGADAFTAALGDGSDFGLEVRYSVEPRPLGTGGALRLAYEDGLPDEPVVVVNGDLVSDLDVRQLMAEHARSAADVTLHVDVVDDVRPFGALSADSAGRLVEFREKSSEQTAGLVNAGTYVWSPRAVEHIPPGRVCSLEREIFPFLVSAGLDVRCVAIPSYWRDAGTRESFLRVNADAVRGALAGAGVQPAPGPDHWASAAAEVSSDVRLTGGTVVDASCRVAGGARIHHSVLLPGATVGPGACLSGVVVGTNGSVQAGASVQDCILRGRPQPVDR